MADLQQAILDSQRGPTLDGMLVVGADGRVLAYNHRYLELWGVGPDFAGRPGFSAGEADGVVHLADGRAIARRSLPLLGWSEPGRVLLYRDVAADDRARLGERLAAVATLAAGVAHEINNPLSYVLANLAYVLDELARAGSGADLREALGDALGGARRVQRIVRDLRTFSRGGDDTLSGIDVGVALDSAIALAAGEIKQRDAQLVRDVEPTPPIAGDFARLGQVFLNLLTNAAAAIPDGEPGHQIRIVVRPVGDCVVVEIADDGSGIPEELHARVFDPFFTTKPIGVGTGMGLSICHGIVTALGGTITFESTPGAGTTFRVTLPIFAGSSAATRSKTRPMTHSPLRKRILVIDDEVALVTALQRILAGHELVAAHSGREAIERLDGDGRFDLILCDLMMPGVTGMAVHAHVAAHHPDLAPRMVFMTGHAFADGAREFLAAVPNRRIEKPFDAEALRLLVLGT